MIKGDTFTCTSIPLRTVDHDADVFKRFQAVTDAVLLHG